MGMASNNINTQSAINKLLTYFHCEIRVEMKSMPELHSCIMSIFLIQFDGDTPYYDRKLINLSISLGRLERKLLFQTSEYLG